MFNLVNFGLVCLFGVMVCFKIVVLFGLDISCYFGCIDCFGCSIVTRVLAGFYLFVRVN